MREIKFRAKRVDNGEWAYGDLHIRCFKPHIHTKPIESIVGLKLNIQPNTIGQFTGLHDKNGKEIYEGDILRSLQSNKLMVVVYDEIGASFVVAVINKNSARKLGVQFHISKNWLKKYPKEVIGNIVDNPELINKED